MRILFVSRGNKGVPSPIVVNQANALRKEGVHIDYCIIGGGLIGYVLGVFRIRRKYKCGYYDLVHAHYAYTAFVASFAGCMPVIASLMGSESHKSRFIILLIRYLSRYRWSITIIKASNMQLRLKLKRFIVIPNGVDMHRFRPMNKSDVKSKLSLNDSQNKLILFLSDPNRIEKNFPLAKAAVDGLADSSIKLMAVYNVSNDIIPFYLNAADVLLLTSRREGSVNVVKEAMACNTPVVSTNVGDVECNLANLPGCFVCRESIEELIEAIRVVINNKFDMESRDRLYELHLDEKSVSKKLIRLYKLFKEDGD